MTPDQLQVHQEPDSLFTRRYIAVTFGFISSVLLTAFEGLAVSTAMPVAVREVNGLAYFSLAATAFATTSLFGMVYAGVRSDLHGPRLPYLGGIAVFGLGLLLSGTATGMAQLVAGRAVQGFGGGMVIVAMYVMVARVYPDDLRATAFALMAALWVMPSVVGPLVAGALTEYLSWRWVFLGVAALIPIPMLVLARPLSPITGRIEPADGVEADPAVGRRRLQAAALTASGVGLLQLAGQELTLFALVFVAGGVVLLVPSVPKLLPRGTLRARRGLPTVVLLRGILAGAYFGAESFMPLMLVEERRISPTLAGLTLFGTAVSWALAAATANRGWIRVSRDAMVGGGSVLVVVSICVTALAVLLPYPAAVVTFATVIGGFGMGLVFPTLSVLTLRLSAPEEQGVNSSSLQIADGLGGILLIGVAGAVFHALHGAQGTNHTLYLLVFGLMAVAGAAAVVIAPRIKTTG